VISTGDPSGKPESNKSAADALFDALAQVLAPIIARIVGQFIGTRQRLMEAEDAAEYLGMTVHALRHKAAETYPASALTGSSVSTKVISIVSLIEPREKGFKHKCLKAKKAPLSLTSVERYGGSNTTFLQTKSPDSNRRDQLTKGMRCACSTSAARRSTSVRFHLRTQ